MYIYIAVLYIFFFSIFEIFLDVRAVASKVPIYYYLLNEQQTRNFLYVVDVYTGIFIPKSIFLNELCVLL